MSKRQYLRDGRAPIPKDERTSTLMSRIRARNTKPEILLRKCLLAHGVRGYRLHHAHLPGRPDIAFVGRKVAVFVHGCFWHGCPHCSPRRPRSNTGFWNAKLDRNMERDKEKERVLRRSGWRVVTIWECRLLRSTTVQVARVIRAVRDR